MNYSRVTFLIEGLKGLSINSPSNLQVLVLFLHHLLEVLEDSKAPTL